MHVLPEVTVATAQAPQLPRLGQLSFINALPVVVPLEKNYLTLSARVTYGSPSELNSRYANRSLDLGAMSSFFYLDHGQLELIPGISISCDGPVGSVLFFSKVSPDKLHGSCIAVPESSATSVNLLKVLLLERLNIDANYLVKAQPDLDDPSVQAVLVIGDRALHMDSDWSNRAWRADLGQWWSQQYNLPMTFGVWAARQDWAQANKLEFEQISETLAKSANLGLSTLFGAVMTEARTRTGLDAYRLQRYYQQQLDFRLTPRHLKGLQWFQTLCARYGLLKQTPAN